MGDDANEQAAARAWGTQADAAPVCGTLANTLLRLCLAGLQCGREVSSPRGDRSPDSGHSLPLSSCVSWANYLTVLCLSFLPYNTGKIMVPSLG